MTDQRQLLTAELKAIDLWDGMLTENPRPDAIEKDASLARFFRRLEVVVELKKLAALYNESHKLPLE